MKVLLGVTAAIALHGGTLAAPQPISSATPRRPSVDASSSCDLPQLSRHGKLVLIRARGGSAISTVAAAGLDRTTLTGEIKIGSGPSKLQVVVATYYPMIIKFSGRVDRLDKVVLVHPHGAGVIGVPSSKVHFSVGEKCDLIDSPQQLLKALGKEPEISEEVNELRVARTNGKTFRVEGGSGPNYTNIRTTSDSYMGSFHPGGVVSIDASKVVSSGKVLKYDVLPDTAGVVQLERSGALVEAEQAEIDAWKQQARVHHGVRLAQETVSGPAYRVTRPIQIPVGLCGGHSVTLFVPSPDFVSGDPCHSRVLALDGHILAPAYLTYDPECGLAAFEALAQPHAPGPLRLRTINCGIAKTSRSYEYIAQASPDARYMGLFPNNWKRLPLRIQQIAENAPTVRDYPVTSTEYSGLGLPPSEPAYRWSQDSTGVWVAKPLSDMQTGRGPLKPAFVGINGSTKEFPELLHPVGPAEGFLWVGGRGRAIASFRPTEVHDPNTKQIIPPTYGMVDASSGIVLDDFKPADFERLRNSNSRLKEFFYANKVVAAQSHDGRLQTLMDFGPWVLWTQGEEPRIASALPEASAAAMSADGKSVLMFRPNLPGEDNRAWYISCDGGEGGRHGPCPKRDAKEGTWASLHDVESGRLLWRLRWTFDRYDRVDQFALSPDGRLALIALLSRSDPSKSLIAIVSMSDGKVLQSLTPPRSDYFMGFAESGRTVWMISWRATTMYSVN